MPHHMIVSGERASRFYNITDKGTHKTVQIKDKVQYAKVAGNGIIILELFSCDPLFFSLYS